MRLPPALLVVALVGAASGAASAQPSWTVVNRYGVLADSAETYARRPDQSTLPLLMDGPARTGWSDTLGPGTPVWVAGCGDGYEGGEGHGGGDVCLIHAILADPELWTAPWLFRFVQRFGDVPRSNLRLSDVAAPAGTHVAGTGVPAGFRTMPPDGIWYVVGPSVDAVNVREGPSTATRVLFEAGRDGRTAIDLLACADRQPGDRGRWCLAGIDPFYDPLDFNGMMPTIGFVYTAALVPYEFDGGFE